LKITLFTKADIVIKAIFVLEQRKFENTLLSKLHEWKGNIN